METRTRLGIVGAGYIADAIAGALENTGAQLQAVASRRRESAEAFAVKHGGSIQVFGTWQDLVRSDQVDAVYVATPTSVREEVSIAAANNKKHVLAEKPFDGLPSLQRIIRACQDNGVAFMDATHFPHHPRTLQLKQELAERIGEIQSIYTAFFFPAMDRNNIRFNTNAEPTGAFGDMAWYSMRAVAEFAETDAALVSGHGYLHRDQETGAIVRTTGALLLTNGCTSTWDAGYSVGAGVMDLSLYGTRGMITLDDFVLDFADSIAHDNPGYPVGFVQREGVTSPTEFARVSTPGIQPQVVHMIRNFVGLTRSPASQAAASHRRMSEKTQGLLDEIWRQSEII